MSIVRELLALFSAFFLAGYFAGWIAIPAALGSWDRLFLSLALSVPATLIAAAPGLSTHSLAPWNVALGIAVLGVAAAWRAKAPLQDLSRRLRARQLHVGRPRAAPLTLVVIAAVLA